MSTVSAASPQSSLHRALCAIVLLVMVLAVIYTGWIAISNFSRIGV